MGWLSQPLARFRAIIEGVYPATPVAGRSVAANTFRATRLHGNLLDPAFPGVHFHRGYALLLPDSGDTDGDAPNVHGGSMRREALIDLALGYVYGQDAALVGAGVGTALETAGQLAHEDHEQIEQAARYPAHWGGTSPTIVSLAPLKGSRVTQRDVILYQRVLYLRRWRIEVSYAPGAVWP